MSHARRIGLDNPAFAGRLRQRSFGTERRSYLATDVMQPPRLPRGHATNLAVIREANQVFRPQPSAARRPRQSKLQLALIGMAGLVLSLGLGATWQTLRINHDTTAQVAALGKHGETASTPDTTKPSGSAVSQYVVAPDVPRYLTIAKLGVRARVMQVGVDSNNVLGVPTNIYDTAWYTGSAKPGQAGATLIDGHVSSWTTHGVFYGLNKLVAGDQLQLERGDGTVLHYTVVRAQTYPAGQVDMQAAITPVTAGKSGLNLISCTGQVIKGTSQYNQRVIVFAQQN